MSVRKIAGLFAGFALATGLIGAGVGASFTDTATAVANVKVGTFGLSITSTTQGAVVVNTGSAGNDVHTVTFQCPPIQSSAPGTCPLQLTLTNTGTMPINVAVSWSTVAVPFQAIPLPPLYGIVVGDHIDISQAGIMWQALTDANLGQSYSVTYTFTATE
jgi:hypothetical protein